ncbi:MAG: P-loop NTPase fold protein [Acidobacteria bacterium]|nr:P-loop NTPase fold protein [Acidobacteriota bacterium]
MNVKAKLLADEYPEKKKICLGFEDYANAFVKLAASGDEPMVFGIFGEWGTGKTTLMKTIEGLFKNPSFTNKYNKNVYTIWFNPWEYPSEESMVKALLHTMISNKEWFPRLTGKKKQLISNIICNLLKALTTTVQFAPDPEKLLKICSESQIEEALLPSSYFSLRETFKRFISELTKKDNGEGSDLMVFFIDDLDRCLPDKIVSILENIRLVFGLNNCVFFIGADRQIVADGIKYVYKNNTGFDGERYLEKIIHVPFFIPQNNNNKLKEYFENLDLEKEYNETLFEILKEVEANPRKIKRIINSIILSWTTFTSMDCRESETKPTDLQIIKLLAILKVIELQWTAFFKDFAQKIGEEDKPILFRIKKLSEEEYNENGDENQPESIQKFLDKYQLKDQNIFNFFKKEIVKETLFDRKIIDKLPDYINSSRGFSQGTESFVQNPERISNEQLLKYLNEGEILKFNQVRERSNYASLNFSGKDFSRIKNLENVNFSQCKLLQANFKGCMLTNANFAACDLQGADFSNADCTGVNFSKAAIEMVNLNKTKLKNARVNEAATLEGTNWWHAKELTLDELDMKQRTQFKEPGTEEEIKNWEDDFKIFHHLPLE